LTLTAHGRRLPWPEPALVVSRAVLVVIFGIAALAKLADLEGSDRAVVDFAVPEGPSAVGGVVHPVAELTVAGCVGEIRGGRRCYCCRSS
jgi:hypothetical protein